MDLIFFLSQTDKHDKKYLYEYQTDKEQVAFNSYAPEHQI